MRPHATIRRSPVAWALCVLLLLTAPASRAASDEWPDLLKRFKDTWKLGGRENKGRRAKLRAKKREAVKLLRGSADGRAIPELLGAHKKQMKFIDRLRDDWKARDEKWKKLQPAMEDALQRAPKNAQGQPLVTAAIAAFFKEKQAIENLYREITNEEEIAEYTRKAMAQVMNAVEGDEHDKALKALLKAAGRGKDAEEREFIRVLGYIRGARVTEALERFADDVQPLLISAALEALGRQNTPGAIDTLTTRLDDPRWQIRVAAVNGLAFYREVKVVELLLARAETADGVLQRHYLAALARMFGHSPGDTSGATCRAFRTYWDKHREDVVKRWAESPSDGPVKEAPPPVMVKGRDTGSTSFYGIKTESKHIIFVIDVSGSMGPEHGGVNKDGKSRIQVVKSELKKAIRSLTAEESDERGVASFNIVSYEATVQVFKPGKMIPATKKNKEAAFEWIDALKAFGATNIYDALEQAFQIIGTRKAKKQYAKGADTIFLMTDGQPNRGKVTDPVLIRQEIAKINRDRKITIHTIGVGEGHAADFLKGLATENAGEYLAR